MTVHYSALTNCATARMLGERAGLEPATSGSHCEVTFTCNAAFY